MSQQSKCNIDCVHKVYFTFIRQAIEQHVYFASLPMSNIYNQRIHFSMSQMLK